MCNINVLIMLSKKGISENPGETSYNLGQRTTPKRCEMGLKLVLKANGLKLACRNIIFSSCLNSSAKKPEACQCYEPLAGMQPMRLLHVRQNKYYDLC
jgi:hypothetical protein